MRGPAIVPSLVTCPMSITAVPVDFAKRTSSAVHSRSCVTAPALERRAASCDRLDRIHHQQRRLALGAASARIASRSFSVTTASCVGRELSRCARMPT